MGKKKTRINAETKTGLTLYFLSEVMEIRRQRIPLEKLKKNKSQPKILCKVKISFKMKTKYFFPEKDKVGDLTSNRITLQNTLKGFSDIRSMIPTGKMDQKKRNKKCQKW